MKMGVSWVGGTLALTQSGEICAHHACGVENNEVQGERSEVRTGRLGETNKPLSRDRDQDRSRTSSQST